MLPLLLTIGHATRVVADVNRRTTTRAGALLLDAWNGTAGVDAVVTALVLAVSRA